MTSAQQLAALISAPGCAVVPGAYDAWSARLVAQAGFSACYMTGFGVSASFLGAPDIGLTTATQMTDCAARMVDAAGIPIIADADTGYGNVLNVRHTVAAYRRAGVAAIQLEDQDFPKRCGHMAGKRVVEASEMVAKIKIAKDTAGEALLVVARTDSRSTTVWMKPSIAAARSAKPAPTSCLSKRHSTAKRWKPSVGECQGFRCWPISSKAARPPTWTPGPLQQSAIRLPSSR